MNKTSNYQPGITTYVIALFRLRKLRTPHLSLIILICVFVLYFAYYVTLRHAAFESFGYDLANVSQSIWNTVHGKPLAMTTMKDIPSRWALHFEPILLLLAPIYALFPSPTTLIVVQVLIVALGALPIFWIARDLLASEWAGVLFAVIYLMFPALQAAVVFDFHAVTLTMTFLAFALWALMQKRYAVFGIWSVLAMSSKEDMSLLVFTMGLYIIFIQHQWKVGGIVVAGGILWFALANFVIIPIHSPIQDNIHIVRYGDLGGSMYEVILSFFTRPFSVLAVAFEPSKLPYWIRLTMPVAFTSFLGLPIFLLASPSLAINTLSNDPLVYRPDVFHYTAPVVPFIVISSISGIARLSRWLGKNNHALRKRWTKRLLIVVIGASIGYHLLAGYTPLRFGFKLPSPDVHDKLAEEMLKEIPLQASVSAQNSLAAHLTNRSYIYIFPKIENAEYIALDIPGDFFPIRERAEYCQSVQQLITDSSYGVIYFSNGLLLLQQDASDKFDVPLHMICNEADQ